jgi:hypothetical protein
MSDSWLKPTKMDINNVSIEKISALTETKKLIVRISHISSSL